MKKKKILFLKNLTQLRNNRNYLHSTDVFGQIIFLNKNKNLINLRIYFRKPIKRVPFLIIKNKTSPNIQNKSNINFNYIKDKKKNFGYVIESNKKLLTRKKYHENLLQKKVKFKKNEIIVPNDKKYNFIEKITSSSMKFLKKISPEKKKKWYLAYIHLSQFKNEKKFKNLKLRFFKKNDSLYNFEIVIKNKKKGVMIFIKK